MFHIRRVQEGGAATVEMAVLMIIFVPLILFTMYASDAVFHTLEVQEAVVVTMWDLSQQSYSQDPKPHSARSNAAGFIDGTVGGFNRIQYADHIGEYMSDKHVDSGGLSFTDDSTHHIQIFGHVCWCNGPGDCDGTSDYSTGEAQQVHCSLSRPFEHEFLTPGALYYSELASAGGLVTCSAKGWLYNYLIPETFLAGFGHVNDTKLFNKKKQSEDTPHKIEGSSGEGADMLLKFRSQLLVDTWAITDGSNINRVDNGNMIKEEGGVGPNEAMFRRTAVVFSNPLWYGSVSLRVGNYAIKAFNKKLLAVPSVPEIPPLGFDPPRIGPNPAGSFHMAPDNPLGLIMSVKFPVTSTDAGGFYTTPYYDKLKTMYNNRRSYYLGFEKSQRKTH